MIAALHLFLGAYLPLILAGLAFVGAAVAYFRLPILGREVAICLVALGTGLLCYRWGYTTRAGQDKSADLRAQIATMQQDIATANKAAEDARAKAETLAAQTAADQDRIASYETFLAHQEPPPVAGVPLPPRRPAGDCRLDRADLRFLFRAGRGDPAQPAAAP